MSQGRAQTMETLSLVGQWKGHSVQQVQETSGRIEVKVAEPGFKLVKQGGV